MSLLKGELLKKIMHLRLKRQGMPNERGYFFSTKRALSLKVPTVKINDKTVVSLLPNLTTLLGLCVGLTAVRFAMQNQYEFAVVVVMIAAIFDSMDGRLARYLNSTSLLGAELDSFSDLVTFGVAPGMVLYYKALHHYGHFGWMIVLFYVCCMALRLARFNVINQDDTLPLWHSEFFIGVPAPMCAYLSFC
ncbi:MAG: CDP-diacylglycerol--serine O-phosphatidyltransferase, partial [Alphaproteobacteria bacterium]|nr:CDP-diacylglycerol--serine O-phosphatidyltransferase [Alphaproteobacteria bacterium]